MNSVIARTTLATALALTGVAGTSGMASAAPATCSGILAGERTGNLTVPADATCTLTDSVVRGDLTVQPGATLKAAATKIRGTLTLTSGTAVTVVDTRVKGAVLARTGTLRPVRDATLTIRRSVARSGIDVASVPSGPGALGQPLALTIDQGSRVVGAVRTKGARVEVNDSRITGDLISTWGHGVTMDSSRVRGATTVSDSYGGQIQLCGSTMAGPADFARNDLGTFVGDKCQGNVFRSDVTIQDNLGVTFSNNRVRGDAHGTNWERQGKGMFGHSNRFKGARSGDFADPGLGR